MPLYRADLLFSKMGRPVVAVEAKARPVGREFERAVKRQLSLYSTEVGTPWALLADPEDTWIFRSADMDRPVARLSTAEVVSEVFAQAPGSVGEQVILVALERLVPDLKNRRDLLRRHPEIVEFADAVAGAEATASPNGRD